VSGVVHGKTIGRGGVPRSNDTALYACGVSADAVELRVLGALLEKQRTTPDQYPLSLNALRLACNQTTNREPVLDLDERTIHEALQRLARRGWTRLASGAGSRAVKHRQLFTELFGLREAETAILTLLLLRGAQTPGELKQRGERLHAFADLDEVLATLADLRERELVERLERRPGQKEERYVQLLGGDEPVASAPAAPAPGAPETEITLSALAARVEALERDVAELRRNRDA
jgi:hypothetical protein